MDRDLLIEKAYVLGINDTDHLSDNQLKEEVAYASLSPKGRADMDMGKKRSVVNTITRVTLPDPVYIPAA